ncbi:hypothetical protein [Fischerella thermalis]|uniref:hypothetical protein n=1 Tax=Fischerella thermalis TaxID=372787 RepID=UPI000C80F9DC|nr:hypothetical protein [Fischerella thermalis]PLZ92208.1 hypothetical protein CI593_05125 [Fischerella thermalis CCMEE 5194]
MRLTIRLPFIYPALVAVFVIGLLILTGIFSQATLWFLLQLVWGKLASSQLWTAVTILIYLGIVWLKYSTSIRDRIHKTQKKLNGWRAV